MKDAPKIDPDGEISPQEEMELYRHYGLDFDPSDSGSSTSGGGSERDAGGERNDAGTSAGAVTRGEGGRGEGGRGEDDRGDGEAGRRTRARTRARAAGDCGATS